MIRWTTVATCLIVALLAIPAAADSLKEAVRAALTTNPALRAASAEARASAFDLLQLRGEYQPTLTATAEAGAQRIDEPSSSAGPSNGDTQFTRQASLEAEILLFDGFARANRVYANAARVDADIFRLLDASETMALNATEVYIDVYRHLLLQDVAQRNVTRHRQLANQVSQAVTAGRLPLSDRFAAQTRVRAAQLALLDVEQAGADAEARFARIVGRPRHGSMALPHFHVHLKSLSDLQETAIANSYRVRVAAKEIGQAEYDTRIVDAERQPRLTFNAGVSTGTNIDGGTGNETDAFVGVRLNWVIHKGGRQAQRNAAMAREQKAFAERQLAIRDVRELATRTWNSLRANRERAQLLGIQAGINRRLVAQYREEFEAGKRSLLEVLDVERASFDIEFERISAEASLAFSRYRILASQSLLAKHFGIARADTVLVPDFEERARVRPTDVFKTSIPPLE